MMHHAGGVLALMMPNMPYYPTAAPSQGLEAHGSYASVTPSITSFPSASAPSSALYAASRPYITEGLKGSPTPKWDQWWCLSTSPCPYGFGQPLNHELRKRYSRFTQHTDWRSVSDILARTASPASAFPSIVQAIDPILVSMIDPLPTPVRSKDAAYWTSVVTSRAHVAESVHPEETAAGPVEPRQDTGLLARLSSDGDPLENANDQEVGEGGEEAEDGDGFRIATGGYPFVHGPPPNDGAIHSLHEEGDLLHVRDIVTLTHTTTVTRTSTSDNYLPFEPSAPMQSNQGSQQDPYAWAPALVCLIAAWGTYLRL